MVNMALVLEEVERLSITIEKMDCQHFILTRFNLLLWDKTKKGQKVRTRKWLEHRFSLFEKYCLPSIINQTCQDFLWIVLLDSTTPEGFKARIEGFRKECPQLIPVFVEPENGWRFAEIFKDEITKRLKAKRVISTYLDNDDALNICFVEDLQRRSSAISDDTFIYYDEGYQYFTEYKYILQIHYPRNHFVSFVEKGDPTTVKGVFCYGTHYYIYTVKGAKIEHVKSQPMWCEIVHEKNMANDAYFFLRTKIVKNKEILRYVFSIDENVESGMGIYLFKFLPRYGKTFVRRTKNYLLKRG